MNDLISVIVPVYNVEKYINKCIESIVNQTYTNLEIILVDDGSSDNCPDICDEWVKKDSRIKVIHQLNSGGGAARNKGLENANGSLISFIDSDDYLSNEMFAHLYNLINLGADIAECEYTMVLDDHYIFDNNYNDFTIYTNHEAMEAHIKNYLFKQVIWNKLYRREIVSNIRFPIDTKIDDEFFTYKVLGNAKKLIHSNTVCYAYRQQNSSIMHSIKPEHYLQAVNAKILRHEYICENFEELKRVSLINLWLTCIYTGQIILKATDQSHVKFIFDYLNEVLRKHHLKIKLDMKKNIIWIFIAKYSLRLVCYLRNYLKKGL
ncbi:MAG: glycosyltransferase [Clostridia bacterium]|nr:glycosyltransferase [Clostridia bacterium]